ncbi:MAG TPA: DUF29 domain-containing protein [Telluria sp.]
MNQLTDSKSLEPVERPADQHSHDRDRVLWADRQARLLRHGRLDELDRENLIEELDAMGGSERRELRSRLAVLLIHLLKCQYQPERKSSGWIATIGEQRSQIALQFEDSPSLAPQLMAYADKAYRSAVTRASLETMLPKNAFPATNPFSRDQLLDLDFIP